MVYLVTNCIIKLDESKYLIVICSPNSAQSKYVGEEIAYFRSKGREREIIPFIIDGIPHSKDRECFHAQLTLGGLELLGIDVQAENSRFHAIRFHQAFIRLVARMLDVDLAYCGPSKAFRVSCRFDDVVLSISRTGSERNSFTPSISSALSQTPRKALP